MSDTKHPLYDAEKSWKEAHKIERLLKLKIQDIEKNQAAAIKETDEVIELYKQLYAILPKTDGTLFGISPLAPNYVIEALMEHIIRAENKEKNFSRRIKSGRLIDFSKPFSFTKAMDQSLGWAFKLEKSDLEKIT